MLYPRKGSGSMLFMEIQLGKQDAKKNQGCAPNSCLNTKPHMEKSGLTA